VPLPPTVSSPRCEAPPRWAPVKPSARTARLAHRAPLLALRGLTPSLAAAQSTQEATPKRRSQRQADPPHAFVGGRAIDERGWSKARSRPGPGREFGDRPPRELRDRRHIDLVIGRTAQ
jgi:hypothetical protein